MKVTRCLLRCGHIARCACRSLFAAGSIRERRGKIGKDKLNCLITTLSVYALLLPTAGLDVAHAAAAEVLVVHDGDTLDVTIQGEQVRIRLYGIDAPERGQHGNVSSTRFLKRLVFGHPLEISVIGADVFGRTLAMVVLEDSGSSVNAAIVANGYAWVNSVKCTVPVCRDWEKIEAQARKLKLGIWSGFDLVPPWEFQERQRN